MATWETSQPPPVLSVSLLLHVDPTDLYNSLDDFLKAFGPYEDPVEMFSESLTLAAHVFGAMKDGDRLDTAWHAQIEAALKGESSFNEATQSLFAIHAVRLAKTEPTMFENGFRIALQERCAQFSLHPFVVPMLSTAVLNGDTLRERHDILGWTSSFKLLGKHFEIEAWETVFPESLVPLPDPNQVVITVKRGRTSLNVTQDAKDAMMAAINGMATKPTIYFNCMQVMHAVTKSLQVDFVEYSVLDKEKLEAFDWDDAVPGEPDTYPTAPQPPKQDYDRVRGVHAICKAEKDAEAQKLGLPHGGCGSYNMARQRWKTWRDLHAIYGSMYPNETKQMICDRVKISHKMAKSMNEIEAKIVEDMTKFIQARKRLQKKQQLQDELTAKANEEEEARRQAAALQQEVQQKAQEKEQLEAQPVETFESAGQRHTRVSQRAAKDRAINQTEEERAAAERELANATAVARARAEETKRLAEAKRKVEQEESKLKVKRTRRNDVAHLNVIMTPRQKGAKNVDWKPPILNNRTWEDPGKKWETEAIKKLSLLKAFRVQLSDAGLVPQDMSFPKVMEIMDMSGDNSTFKDRVFFYLLYLILCQHRLVVFSWVSHK